MPNRDVPDWIDPTMRAGYAARSAVYVILGGLTFFAAWTGAQAEGTQGALATLRDKPFGTLLLWSIAAGLLCYGVWRLIAAWYDLENRGSDEKGTVARIALVVTGLTHGALGIAVASLAMGGPSGDGSARDWTARLMSMPFGKWLVAIAGVALVGAAVHYAVKGWNRKYERHIRVTPTTRKLDPALRAGFIAYAVVLGLVGVFLTIAAIQADPSQAKGIGDALAYVRNTTTGPWLLGLLGLGLIGFALENAVEAAYRIVPGADSPDVESLAQYARRKADEATG